MSQGSAQTRIPTIDSCPDQLWDLLRPILERGLPARNSPRGRKRLDLRTAFNGILYAMRTGIQWRMMPREFGSGVSIWRYHALWTQSGAFEAAWKLLLEWADAWNLVGKESCLDGCIVLAPKGGDLTGPSPVHRGRKGTKRSLLVDNNGIPLGVAIAAANTPDSRIFEETLAARLIGSGGKIWLDLGYFGAPVRNIAEKWGYEAKVPPKRKPFQTESDFKEEHRDSLGVKTPRWVVERSHSWENAMRGLAKRYFRSSARYRAMVCLSCALSVWRAIQSYQLAFIS